MSSWNETVWTAFLASAAVKGTAVLGAAWMLAWMLRKRSAAARHLVWTAAFAAVLAMPVLSVMLPALRIHVPAPWSGPVAAFQTTVLARAEAGTPAAAARGSAQVPQPPAPWSPDLRLVLLVVWSAGTGIALLQLAAGWAALVRMRRIARPFADREFAGAAQLLKVVKPVELLATPEGSMPLTFGLMRPAILIPADAAEWTAERRRVVLLHELAHVRRGDLATHLLARIALSAYWWNPLAWLGWREFLKERERAADDLVLNSGARASEYAGHLLEIARRMQPGPGMSWAAIAVARRSQLEGRLVAILDPGMNRAGHGRASAWAASLAAIAMIAPFAAVEAQDKPAAVPANLEAAIRSATAQKNPDALESAAKAAAGAQNYDAARKLLDASLELRAQNSGTASVEYGVTLVKLGELEHRRKDDAQADAFYEKAVAVLGDREESAQALFYLGKSAMGRKQFEAAIAYFQRAQLAGPGKFGPATMMMWTAMAEQRRENMQEAAWLYQKTLAVQDPNSAEAATTMELYGHLLGRMPDREAEGKALLERAAALRKTLSDQALMKAMGTRSDVYRIGGGVTAPKLIAKIEPEYTEEARAALIEGTVVLSTEIGPDGLTRNIRVVTGMGLGLDEKAVEAIRHWRFQPGVKDGQPVAVAAMIEVNFRLL